MDIHLVARKIYEDRELREIAICNEGDEDEGRAVGAITLAKLAQKYTGEAALWLLMEAIEIAASLDVTGYYVEEEKKGIWTYRHPAGVFTS